MTEDLHGSSESHTIIDQYEAYELGAPFKIVLHNAVVSKKNTRTNRVKYQIPDLEGLLWATALARILHPQKLSGRELKYLRKVSRLKQKALAQKVRISAEHLSRCESEQMVLSPPCESLARVQILKTLYEDTVDVSNEHRSRYLEALRQVLDCNGVIPAHDVDDRIELHFYRVKNSSACQEKYDDGAREHWDDYPALVVNG